MALLTIDRIQETSATLGIITLILDGAKPGFRPFSDIGNGQECLYCVEEVDANGIPTGLYEVGRGTYTLSGTTLSRTEVYRNSSGTQALISFVSTTKNVFVTDLADFLLRGIVSGITPGIGDLLLSNGTHTMFYDASTGILKMDGIITAVTIIDLDGSVNGKLTGLNIKNSDSGTLASAILSVNSDAAGIGMSAYSTGFTPVNAAKPSTGLINTGNGMTGGMNFQTGVAGLFQFGWWQAGSESWSITTSRHLVTGQTGIDIGTTSDATQPRDVHINRALNVGDVAATTSEGDAVFGDGTREMRWDASVGSLLLEAGFLIMGSGSGPTLREGIGTPEGAVTAPVGSLFMRTNGGAATSFYVKESGTGNTGWVAK